MVERLCGAQVQVEYRRKRMEGGWQIGGRSQVRSGGAYIGGHLLNDLLNELLNEHEQMLREELRERVGGSYC